MATKTEKTKSVTISCKAPEAKAVFVAGTFNDWNPTAAPLKGSKTGKWSAKINLQPGRYEYKFVVDGDWCCAPGCSAEHDCPNCVINEHGTMNRVLEVS